MNMDTLASQPASVAKDRGSGRTGTGGGFRGQWRLKASPLPSIVMESQAALTVPLTLQGKLGPQP